MLPRLHLGKPVSAPYHSASGVWFNVHYKAALDKEQIKVPIFVHCSSSMARLHKPRERDSHLSTIARHTGIREKLGEKVLKLQHSLGTLPLFCLFFFLSISVKTVWKAHANNSSNLNAFGFSLLALYCPCALWYNDFGCFHFNLEWVLAIFPVSGLKMEVHREGIRNVNCILIPCY